MSHRKLKTLVRGVSDGKFEDIERSLTYPGDDQTNGIGMFINQEACIKYIIDTYKPDLDKLDTNPDDATISDEFIVFDIGKTALLMLLAQESAEGIRLIKIKNAKGDASFVLHGITSTRDSVSTMAIPVKNPAEGADPVITEEIHGYNLRTAREIIRINNPTGPVSENQIINFFGFK